MTSDDDERLGNAVFSTETAARCNARRHIIYVKFGDKFSPQRWPDPRRGTFEGISLIGHKIGTEGPLTSPRIGYTVHAAVWGPIRLKLVGPAERGPFTYNELNYVHTGVLAALTFLRRIVRKHPRTDPPHT